MSPRIVAFANRKGGVGKTTLSVHYSVIMARAGKRVLLIDADPDRNAAEWIEQSQLHATAGLSVVTSEADRLGELRTLHDYERVVIDLPGTTSDELDAIGSVQGIVDLVVCPTRPNYLDVKPLSRTLSGVTTPHLVVLWNTPSRWSHRADDMREQLGQAPFNYRLARTQVRRYQAWEDAADYGCLVTDLRAPNAYADVTGAVEEIESLLKKVN